MLPPPVERARLAPGVGAGYTRCVRVRLPSVVLAALVVSGCSAVEQQEHLQHRIDVVDDTLGHPPLARPDGEPVTVDLVCTGFEGDARHVLFAVVDALEADPRVTLATMRYEGAQAAFGRRRRGEPAAPVALELTARAAWSGSAQNPLLAFPGMLWFLPMWLGYRWEGAITVEARLTVEGAPRPPRAWTAEVAFRERNAPRSALFHLWPTTGFYGVQFLLGLVLAPTFLFYDAEETTPALVAALEPRLGRSFASRIVPLLRSAAGPGPAAPVMLVAPDDPSPSAAPR